ncbi:DUF5518 domain-containing protein [Natronococcus sp. A-GB1]|uniref:DUF5518 domain-containing protein n=1 Tax=Natronococcus sp. A-GB1 TaxID=3037648 RepID=UPI00241F1C11|nr:DUF5518 domain-containing protein [Natronococcus sp. A-GB1]MDG5759993.1 DUF5518 domain-containing protein [Natronococcus sp. A-GB1]
MGSTPAERVDGERHPTADGPLPEVVDWILATVVALVGLLSVVAGSALVFLVDRDGLAAGIEDGTVTVTVATTELTDAEALEVADAAVSWTGTGLLVVGAGTVLVAVGYLVARRRAHRRSETGEPTSSYGTYAVLGAVVTVVLSFVPFSPALGGGVAGYLARGESDRTVRVGALAGFLPAAPVLAVLVFVLGGLIAGLLTIGQIGEAIVVGTTLLLTALLVATLAAALGALGGYVGGRFAERRATTSHPQRAPDDG